MQCHTGAVVPILRLGELLIPFHVTPDFHAECLQDVHGYEQVRYALRVFKTNHGVFLRERQRHQQTGNELRTASTGNLRFAGIDTTLNSQWDKYFRALVRLIRHESYPERAHNFFRAFQRSAGQCLFAGDVNFSRPDHRDERNHHSGKKPRLAGMQFAEGQRFLRRAYSFYGQCR